MIDVDGLFAGASMFGIRARHPLLLLALVAVNCTAAEEGGRPALEGIDHLIYATPDLDRGIGEIEELLGVRATVGGSHPGRGTRNALIALGPAAYLEILAPDPDQERPPAPLVLGLDTLTTSRLATWVARSANLDSLRASAVRNGIPLGEVQSGSRQRPDGTVLTWRLTDPRVTIADGLIPFFIDWGESPHPSRAAPQGAALVALRGEHPDDGGVRRMLEALGLDVPVTRGPSALVAVVDGRRGRVELR